MGQKGDESSSKRLTFLAFAAAFVGDTENKSLVVKFKFREFGVPHGMFGKIGSIWHGTDLVFGERKPTKVPSISPESCVIVEE